MRIHSVTLPRSLIPHSSFRKPLNLTHSKFAVLPRLRQKFIKDPETGERILAREREERKTSWLELFYDLIFVALVSQLTHALAGNPAELLRFSTLYVIIWRSWHGPTMFRCVAFLKTILPPLRLFGFVLRVRKCSTRYDTSDLINKGYYYLQMIAIVAMGINLHSAYENEFSIGFLVAFLIARAFHLAMYTLAHLSEASPVTYQSIISIPLFSIPFIVSIFLPHLTDVLWSLGAFAEEVSHWGRTIIISTISPSWTSPVSIEHLTERNGLFVMIILGECVAGSMFRKTAEGELIGFQFYAASALGLLIAFSLQWIYFDTEVLFLMPNGGSHIAITGILTRILQGRPKKAHALRRAVQTGALWGSFHVPLIGFVMVGSAGLLIVMERLGELETPMPSSPTSDSHHTIYSEAPISVDVVPALEQPMSSHKEVPTAARWLIAAGFGSASLVAALLGLLSVEYELRIPRALSTCLRILAAVLTILTPLMCPKDMPMVSFLSIIAALTFFAAVCTLIGGLAKPHRAPPVTPLPTFTEPELVEVTTSIVEESEENQEHEDHHED